MSAHATLKLSRERGKLGTVARKARHPFLLDAHASRTRIPTRTNLMGNLKRRMLPANRGTRRGDLVLAQRFAMRLGTALPRR